MTREIEIFKRTMTVETVRGDVVAVINGRRGDVRVVARKWRPQSRAST